MKKSLRKYAETWLLLVAATFLLAGCATQDKLAFDSAPEPEQENAIEFEPWDGDGMEIPLDGSSMDAWKRSMARVKAYSDPDAYTSLEAALGYLRTYDLSARGSMDNLIEQLDGMTGYEVVSRVRWRKPAPGKGLPEKGAADAKIIDT
jgi:hypothetical protein